MPEIDRRKDPIEALALYADKAPEYLPFVGAFSHMPSFSGMPDLIDLTTRGNPLQNISWALTRNSRENAHVFKVVAPFIHEAQVKYTEETRRIWLDDPIFAEVEQACLTILANKAWEMHSTKVSSQENYWKAHSRAYEETVREYGYNALNLRRDFDATTALNSKLFKYMILYDTDEKNVRSRVQTPPDEIKQQFVNSLLASFVDIAQESLDINFVLEEEEGVVRHYDSFDQARDEIQVMYDPRRTKGRGFEFHILTGKGELMLYERKTGRAVRSLADILDLLHERAENERFTLDFEKINVRVHQHKAVQPLLRALVGLSQHDDRQTLHNAALAFHNSYIQCSEQGMSDEIEKDLAMLLRWYGYAQANNFYVERENKARDMEKPNIIEEIIKRLPHVDTTILPIPENIPPDVVAFHLQHLLKDSNSSTETMTERKLQGDFVRNITEEEYERLKRHIVFSIVGEYRSLLHTRELITGIDDDTGTQEQFTPYTSQKEYAEMLLGYERMKEAEAKNGKLSLSVAPSHELDSVKLVSLFRGPLIEGKDYVVERDARLGTYRIKLETELTGETYRYSHVSHLSFREHRNSIPPNQLMNLDVSFLEHMKKKVESFGFTVLADELEILIKERNKGQLPVSINDLASVFIRAADYSYNPKYHLLPNRTLLEQMRGYIDPDTGACKVQCRSAAMLYSAFLNEYFEAVHPEFRAFVVSLYHTYDSEITEATQIVYKKEITANMSHARVLIVQNGIPVYEQDTTPFGESIRKSKKISQQKKQRKSQQRYQDQIQTLAHKLRENPELPLYIQKHADLHDPLIGALRLSGSTGNVHELYKALFPGKKVPTSQAKIRSLCSAYASRQLSLFLDRARNNPSLFKQFPIYQNYEVVSILQSLLLLVSHEKGHISRKKPVKNQ